MSTPARTPRTLPSSEKGSPADDHGRDRVQLDADTRVGKSGFQFGRQESTRKACEKAVDHVDDDQDAIDVDAGYTRRMRITADRENVATRRCKPEEQP